MNTLVRNQERMYILYEDGSRLILSVVCGGIGMFEVKVILTVEEVESYRERGEFFLDDLAYDIGKDLNKYAARTLKS